jgi:hypothetical protein
MAPRSLRRRRRLAGLSLRLLEAVAAGIEPAQLLSEAWSTRLAAIANAWAELRRAPIEMRGL